MTRDVAGHRPALQPAGADSACFRADEHALDEILLLNIVTESAGNIAEIRLPVGQQRLGVNLSVTDVFHSLAIDGRRPVRVKAA